GPVFGLYLSYFFDLRFALQFGFLTGDHAISYSTPSDTVRGNLGYNSISFDLKYYFNTQNVTRGLADLNPYVIGGFSQVYRTIIYSDAPEFTQKDSAIGVDAGVGIEIPMMRNKM